MATIMYGADDKVSRAGDSMSGTLTLDGGVPLAIPAGCGNGLVLTSDAAGNATWQPVTSGSYVATTGGTMTGPLILSGAPTTAKGAATKSYVDAETARAENAESGLNITILSEVSRAEQVEATLLPLSGGTVTALAVGGGATVTGTVALKDATAPTTNPTGGVYLYSTSGSPFGLRYRDAAGMVRTVGPAVALATGSQSVTSSTTQVASHYLTLAVEASAIYLMRMSLTWTGAAAANAIAHGFTAPSGSTLVWSDSTFSTTKSLSSLDTWTGQGLSTPLWTMYSGVLTTGSTAGSLTMTFAQGVSSTTATFILAGSHLVLERVQ